MAIEQQTLGITQINKVGFTQLRAKAVTILLLDGNVHKLQQIPSLQEIRHTESRWFFFSSFFFGCMLDFYTAVFDRGGFVGAGFYTTVTDIIQAKCKYRNL